MSNIETPNKNEPKSSFSDKSPLLRTYSSPEIEISHRNLPKRGKNKHTYSVRHWNTISNPLDMPKSSDDEEIKDKRSSMQYKNKTFEECGSDDTNPADDFAAMSVVNIYKSGEDLDKDMDTNSDFLDYKRIHQKPKIIIQQNSSQAKMDTPDTDGQPVTNTSDTTHLEIPDDIPNSNHDGLNGPTKTCCYSEIRKCPKPTIFFKDGIRSVDFVLVWYALNEKAVTPGAYMKRQIFERNLLVEGLELEYEPQETNGFNFIKVHAPIEVLRRYGEILKLRMPMREIPALRQVSRHTSDFFSSLSDRWQQLKTMVFVDKEKFPEKAQQRFTAIYSRDREYLFDTESPCFFTPAIHSRIVQFILDRKRFGENLNDDFSFGVERLLNDGIYESTYPLHDGDLKTKGTLRNLLYTEWASIKKWHRYQPLDYVKEYFGVKIALYFAWLGFYTNILIAPAVVGLICFIYSLSTMYSNKISKDICNLDLKEKMCPLCDGWCDYWDLKETCVHSRITYLFDNPTTVFFAIFMSFWATTFLEMWKRYSAEITHRWDLTGFDVQEEHPRPQYLARLAHVKRKSVNIVTNTMEPHVPFWKIRVPMTILSFSVVLLLVFMALATVVAVVLYRMSVLVSLKVHADKVDNSSAILFTTITAASINLVAIVIFNYIYTFVAEYLTEFELLRTQTEFDDSLTLKIYLLQFVNYYASIFYIAFFKGKFVGSPKGYNRIFGYRQEECGPGGCLLELCIQLAVIMIGKQAMNTVLEMSFPLFFKWLNTLKVKTGLAKNWHSQKGCGQWLKDFKLVEWGPRSLFPEYLEMVLQYGFVTIFVAAFPLAPLFALLNNILEMRLDAKKLLTLYRRPVSQRVKDIGVWYRILDAIGKLSVVTNGFIIAFTSDFIPRLVYRISISPNGTLNGYLNNSLSYFNTSDFETYSLPNKASDVKVCRYPDYRNPYNFPHKYELTALYWHILAARLIFVVVFENLVVLVMIIVKWCIPDMSGELRDRIRREIYITNEIIIKQESLRTKNGNLRTKKDRIEKIEKLRNLKDMPSTPEQWDMLISKSLSQSDFDLMVHGNERQTQDPNNEPGTPCSI